MEENNLTIAILDSGINASHPCFKDASLQCYFVSPQAGIIEQECTDEIGHGTAVAFLIHKQLPKAKLLCFKIFSDDNYKTENLVDALEYLYEKADCNIINISLGTTYYEDLGRLGRICCRLKEKGVLIVSAFDNSGIISYPAAFPQVIGVDVSNRIHKVSEYEFVENSVVNIRGYYREQNLPWLGNGYMTVSGASFAAPYITVFVAKLLVSGVHGFEDVMCRLKENAVAVLSYENHEAERPMEMKNAVLFPFNKEMHSLARFGSLLSVHVAGIYDVKYVGNIGKKTSELLGELYGAEHIIQNYRNIRWEDEFDSVILGHTSDLSRIIGIDFEEYFVEHCIRYRKSLFSFAALREESVLKMKASKTPWYYPCVMPENVPRGTFGKLKRISKPVVAVVGTSQKQGKFTLQLKLKLLFEQSGYKIGMLGTEPSSLLFGADEVYPIGFESTVYVDGYESIMYINGLMGKIEEKNPDLILVGSQSQTVPVTDGWIGFYPIKQHELLLACAPDCYILCVNVSDDMQYIKRTISYLENILPSKVICLALFPFELEHKWSVIGTSKKMADDGIVAEKIKELRTHLKKKVVNLADEKGVYKIAKECIRYFQ